MTAPKRLIEVELPLARISAHARTDKSVREGHLSTLHIWWARRPLAACRAVLCATLWPDPADEACPDSFRRTANERLAAFIKEAFGDLALLQTAAEQSKQRWMAWAKSPPDIDEEDGRLELRAALLDFLADFASWDNALAEAYLDTARALTEAAHLALGGEPGTRPLVIDPFAGGGAIPLETARIGAEAYASDLNPVAVLLNHTSLSLIPEGGEELAEELRAKGRWVRDEARKALGALYPKDAGGATPIVYFWARTVKCEGPTCGRPVPMIRNFWLKKSTKAKVGLQLTTNAKKGTLEFAVILDPRSVRASTVKKGAAVCPWCDFVTPVARVRAQLRESLGGANGATLFAVLTQRPKGGREFRAPGPKDQVPVQEAAERHAKRAKERLPSGLTPFPDEPLPPVGTLGFRVQQYGMKTFGDLMSHRQAVAMDVFAQCIREVEKQKDTSPAISVLLSFALGRVSDLNSSLSSWKDTVVGANGAQNRLSMVWDYTEVAPLEDATGSWEAQVEWVAKVVEHIATMKGGPGTAERSPAQRHPLPDDAAAALVTDPPYYDAFAYSDLSDLFLVWLKRSALDPKRRFSLSDPRDRSPKAEEIVVNPKASADGRGAKDHDSFTEGMRQALTEARRVVRPDGIGVVVFAHKATKSWESLLEAVVTAGWIVTGSWPIDTERPTRQRAIGSAALSSSVHIVCRPREAADGTLRQDDVGDWRDVLAELPKRVHAWLPRLAAEGVVGADAIFACLGPALEVFSRYSRVERASGDAVTLREYLEHVWAAVANEAMSMIFREVDAGGLEPDGRLTAMWLWTLGAAAAGSGPEVAGDEEGEGEEEGDGDETEKPKGKAKAGYTLEFDAARKIAQGLGADLELLPSVVELASDKARLLPVAERAQYLFAVRQGEGAKAAKTKAKKGKKAEAVQTELFDGVDAVAKATDDAGGSLPAPGETVLDRLHQVMLLFAAGRNEAVRRFLVDEGAGRDARLWKLAQSLSALYPNGSDERRWVEGVLARKKGLGL